MDFNPVAHNFIVVWRAKHHADVSVRVERHRHGSHPLMAYMLTITKVPF